MHRGYTSSRFVASALLAGKHRLVRPLGERGMGVAWSAVNEATSGQVALGLAPREAAAIGRDIACALPAARGQGILHRDLKPANVFRHEAPGGDGRVVNVVDFDASKIRMRRAAVAGCSGR